MAKLIQMDFPYTGPFGKQMADALSDMARSITEEPGFLWKIWTENEETNEAGGIYLFADEETAVAYVKKHVERLEEFGISEIRVKMFDVNEELTGITRGPLG